MVLFWRVTVVQRYSGSNNIIFFVSVANICRPPSDDVEQFVSLQ